MARHDFDIVAMWEAKTDRGTERPHPTQQFKVRCRMTLLGQEIGIGGRLAVPPLPHHRAYGSVPRQFGGLSIHQFLHWRHSETTETGFGKPTAVQGFREAQSAKVSLG